MRTLLQIDTDNLRLRNLRVQQLRSYQGTPDELPGDDARLRKARRQANQFAIDMLMFHLDTSVCAPDTDESAE